MSTATSPNWVSPRAFTTTFDSSCSPVGARTAAAIVAADGLVSSAASPGANTSVSVERTSRARAQTPMHDSIHRFVCRRGAGCDPLVGIPVPEALGTFPSGGSRA